MMTGMAGLIAGTAAAQRQLSYRTDFIAGNDQIPFAQQMGFFYQVTHI